MHYIHARLYVQVQQCLVDLKMDLVFLCVQRVLWWVNIKQVYCDKIYFIKFEVLSRGLNFDETFFN